MNHQIIYNATRVFRIYNNLETSLYFIAISYRSDYANLIILLQIAHFIWNQIVW